MPGPLFERLADLPAAVSEFPEKQNLALCVLGTSQSNPGSFAWRGQWCVQLAEGPKSPASGQPAG